MITLSHPRWHLLAWVVTRAGAAVSASMLALTVLAMSSPHVSPAYAAATDAGPVQVIDKPLDGSSIPSVPLSSGGSATEFSLRPPSGAACTGDSASSDPAYLVQTYMVPASVDVSTLTFGSDGPVPVGTGTSFRQPLYTTTGSPAAGMLTGVASPAPGPGEVINIPALTFALFAPGDIPAGTYNVGVACTTGGVSATQLDKFWNVRMEIATVTAGPENPAGINWTVAQADQSTTTTTTPGATTTTIPGATTTTTPGATTTTTSGGATTTTTRGATTTTIAGGTTGTSAGGGATGLLSRTGGLSASLVVWSLLLLVFGRMVVLFARRPGVPPGAKE